MACTVRDYARHLVEQVIAGGNLNDAYRNHALPEKQRQQAADTFLKNLRAAHPDLAAQVDAGTLTLEQARAASEADDRETLQARFRAKALADIKLAIEEIGPVVALPPPPDLSMVWHTDDGELETRDVAPTLDDAALKRTQDFLHRLKAVRNDLEALSQAQPVDEFAMLPGGITNAVRQWASQAISHIYRTVEVYEQEAKADRKLRRVQ